MNWLKKLGMPSTLSLQRTCLYSPVVFFFFFFGTEHFGSVENPFHLSAILMRAEARLWSPKSFSV